MCLTLNITMITKVWKTVGIYLHGCTSHHIHFPKCRMVGGKCEKIDTAVMR